jgi:hypothetical protein
MIYQALTDSDQESDTDTDKKSLEQWIKEQRFRTVGKPLPLDPYYPRSMSMAARRFNSRHQFVTADGETCVVTYSPASGRRDIVMVDQSRFIRRDPSRKNVIETLRSSVTIRRQDAQKSSRSNNRGSICTWALLTNSELDLCNGKAPSFKLQDLRKSHPAYLLGALHMCYELFPLRSIQSKRSAELQQIRSEMSPENDAALQQMCSAIKRYIYKDGNNK